MDINSYLATKDPRYYLPDTLRKESSVVFFDSFPKRRDIEKGYSVTIDETQGGAKILGESTALLTALSPASFYISNVILVPTDKETEPLRGPLEGVRLGQPNAGEVLRERFKEKMRAIIDNENIRLVVYKGDMFRRYYNDYLRNERRQVLEKLSSRLDSGLKIIPMPSHTASQLARMQSEYDNFVDSLIGLAEE